MSLEDRIGIFLAEHPDKIYTVSEIREILNIEDRWGLTSALRKLSSWGDVIRIAVERPDDYVMGYKIALTRSEKGLV